MCSDFLTIRLQICQAAVDLGLCETKKVRLFGVLAILYGPADGSTGDTSMDVGGPLGVLCIVDMWPRNCRIAHSDVVVAALCSADNEFGLCCHLAGTTALTPMAMAWKTGRPIRCADDLLHLCCTVRFDHGSVRKEGYYV